MLLWPERLQHVGRRAPPAARTVPHDAGIALQRHQRLAAVRPLRGFADGDVIARLTPGPRVEQGARDIHPFRRVRALVDERRAAPRTEAACAGFRLVTGDGEGALRD